MDKYARGWRDCQTDRNEEMAKLDDEIKRGGRPLATLIVILMFSGATAIMIAGLIKIAETIDRPPVADTINNVGRGHVRG
jgi:hypothetical protein